LLNLQDKIKSILREKASLEDQSFQEKHQRQLL